MTDWDIYCALCGGPFIAFRRFERPNVCTPPCRCVPGAPPQYDCAADAYDPEVLTGADDPGVAWLTDFRIIGTNSYSDETCKVWTSGRARGGYRGEMSFAFEGSDPIPNIPRVMTSFHDRQGSIHLYDNTKWGTWAAPFHVSCRQLLCRHLQISKSQLNEEVFYNALKDLAEPDDPNAKVHNHKALGMSYGDIERFQQQLWKVEPGTEHLLMDPVDIKNYREFMWNLPVRTSAVEKQVALYNTEKDPFAKLGEDILLLVASHLIVPDDVLKLRETSPAFANLRLSNSFWKSHVYTDMPWLYDFPPPNSFKNTKEIDWEQTYRKLWWGSKASSAKANKFYGLCNRKRIWNQTLPIITRKYREHKSLYEQWGTTQPTVLKGAYEAKAKRLACPEPVDGEWTSISLMDKFEDLRTVTPSLLIDWADDGHLLGIRSTDETGHSTFLSVREPIVQPAKTDKVRIPDGDWLTGFITTSRSIGEDEADTPARQVTGLEILFARQSPIPVGSVEGDKRIIYVSENRFIVGLKMQGISSGTLAGLTLLEHHLSLAQGCVRVVDKHRGDYNQCRNVAEYLWRKELPPLETVALSSYWDKHTDPSANFLGGPMSLWGEHHNVDHTLSDIDMYPMEALIIAKSEEEAADITGISIDARMGGMEVTYGHRESRTIGPRREAMKKLTINGRGGERVSHIGIGNGKTPGSLRLATDEQRYLTVIANTDIQTPRRYNSPDSTTTIVPYGVFGYWGKSQRWSTSPAIVATLGIFTGVRRGAAYRPPRLKAGWEGVYWQPSALPSHFKTDGPVWGPGDISSWHKERATQSGNILISGRMATWIDCSRPLLEIRVTLVHSLQGTEHAPLCAMLFKYADGTEWAVGPEQFATDSTCEHCTPEICFQDELEAVPHYRHETWNIGGRRLTSMKMWRAQDSSIAAIQLIAEGQTESPIWGHWGHDLNDGKVVELRFQGESGGEALGVKCFFLNNAQSSGKGGNIRGDVIIAGFQALHQGEEAFDETDIAKLFGQTP